MQIYNSMTRKKEEFKPIHEGKVGIYACGPTVYNYFHIGNARPFIVFDVLRRYFEYKGYEVTFVQNFTDIDDKMIRRANEENTTVAAIAEKYIAEYFVDAKALGVRPATVHPRATEHMPQIIGMIETLVNKGLAYESNGDVYYRVRAFKDYGCLCGQNLEDLASGARVSVDEQKEDPLDFALWKAQKPGEPAWESPWGMGRPGWHIECSAMSTTYLGETFDIHAGGKDLLFPHHENEIAQTSGATGKPYVNYWMHNGFLNIDNEKMSKSKGNVVNPNDIVAEFGADTMRTYIMFIGDFEKAAPWQSKAVKGCKRFLDKIWNLSEKVTEGDAYSAQHESAVHKAIKKVTNDIDNLKANTAIATLMSLVNDFTDKGINKAEMKTLLQLVSPFAPHIAEELWEQMGFEGLCSLSVWPEYDEEKTKDTQIEIAIQINGKFKGTVPMAADSEEADVIAAVSEDDRVKKQLSAGGSIVKTIYVKNKLVNLIIK